MVDVELGLILTLKKPWLAALSGYDQDMIFWTFAYDEQNLSVYYGQMDLLDEQHPQVYEYMKNRGVSGQIGPTNPFGRIPVDQTVKETANRDIETAGETKRFTLKPGPLSCYYVIS